MHPFLGGKRDSLKKPTKLIRQYIPEKINFDKNNCLLINQIQYKLNSRPEAGLNFYSPKEILSCFCRNKVASGS
jgi:IS30 family transposase